MSTLVIRMAACRWVGSWMLSGSCVPPSACVCRSQASVGSALPPYKVGSLNSKLFLSELLKREKSLRRTLEGTLISSSVTSSIPTNFQLVAILE